MYFGHALREDFYLRTITRFYYGLFHQQRIRHRHVLNSIFVCKIYAFRRLFLCMVTFKYTIKMYRYPFYYGSTVTTNVDMNIKKEQKKKLCVIQLDGMFSYILLLVFSKGFRWVFWLNEFLLIYIQIHYV